MTEKLPKVGGRAKEMAGFRSNLNAGMSDEIPNAMSGRLA